MSSVVRINDEVFDASIQHFSSSFRHIEDMEELRKLRLFPELTSASFAGTNLDDVGLAHVSRVATLTNLNLQETKISNEGLACLEKLPKLDCLRLKDNLQLTNACVRNLVRLVGLTNLSIHETSIDEAGLRELTVLQRLEDLCIDVWDDSYSFDGLLEISATMPACRILAKGQGEFLAGKFEGRWTARRS